MISRLPFFPAPLPGENLYSLLARFHIHLGSPSPRATFAAVTGVALLCPDRQHHGSICSMQKRLPHGYSQSAYELLEKYTHFRFRAFFEGAPDDGLIAFRATPYGYWHWVLPWLNPNCRSVRSELFPKRKFCPSCVRDDVGRWGAPYWRNVHAIDEVAICPWHGCLLEVSCMTCDGFLEGQRPLFKLPPLRCPSGHPFLPRQLPNAAVHNTLLGVARCCVTIIGTSMPLLPWRAAHKRLADVVIEALGTGGQHHPHIGRPEHYVAKLGASIRKIRTVLEQLPYGRVCDTWRRWDDLDIEHALKCLHNGHVAIRERDYFAALLLLADHPDLLQRLFKSPHSYRYTDYFSDGIKDDSALFSDALPG